MQHLLLLLAVELLVQDESPGAERDERDNARHQRSDSYPRVDVPHEGNTCDRLPRHGDTQEQRRRVERESKSSAPAQKDQRQDTQRTHEADIERIRHRCVGHAHVGKDSPVAP